MSTIKTFDDISWLHQIDNETLNGIKNRLVQSMGMELEKFGFTGLQKAAFNTKGFWLSDNDYRHIIIQGATSAGKTLVSEMAILDTLKNNNKCIVLVPLRAMVRERWKQLREDFGAQEGDRRIYASSADYQDHDGEIMDGNYSVAIIVYEKFFTMLSQSRDNMLRDCELLVVDELQMLSNANRGPKLEIAIQKVLRRNKSGNVGDDTQTRIMCLTTSDCKVKNIKRWLTVDEREPILIEYDKRPVTLIEHVIRLDGEYRCRTTPGEESDKFDEIVDGEGLLPMPESNISFRKVEAGKRNLLKNLLQNIYAKNPAAKVLIFVNGRRKTQDIAEFVASENILPSTNLTGELTEIDNYDGDEKFYSLTSLGKGMASYAFSLSTCRKIDRFFFNGGRLQDNLKPGKGGLPETITREDFDNNRYLLDMLYILCSTSEIRSMSQLKLPPSENVEKSRKAMDQVEKLLKKIISTENGGYDPWAETFKYMCTDNYD